LIFFMLRGILNSDHITFSTKTMVQDIPAKAKWTG